MRHNWSELFTPALTPRQEQILQLIGDGLTNRQIGDRLAIAEKTVKNSVTDLLAALNLQRRSQAAVYSVTHALPPHVDERTPPVMATLNMLIIGPQGAGKGTQAGLLAGKLRIPHISTGDIFRANITARTPLGVQCQRYTDAGELVPDHVTTAMIAGRLAEPDAHHGFILDGFPRTIAQAGVLNRLLGSANPLHTVLVLDAPTDVVVQRLHARGRVDDTTDAITRRLEIYRAETQPLLDLYSPLLVTVDGVGSVDEVQQRIQAAVQRRTRDHPSQHTVASIRTRDSTPTPTT